jgi:peptide/nickel transport system ATP-binding protein
MSAAEPFVGVRGPRLGDESRERARPLLEVQGLSTGLGSGRIPILDDISFALRPGEVLGVVGESGSGKSMLALSIMGLLPRAIRRTAGRIVLEGEDLAALGPRAWRAKRGRDLAMIFQEPLTALNPVMPVGMQVTEVLTRRRGLRGSEARREAIRLFERVEIPSAEARLASYPHEMSGGMRQRVVIATALAAQPKLLVADEPTTALDVTIQAQILDLLRDLQREQGLSMLLITHDLGVIAEAADQVLVLYAGRVAEIAPVRRLFDAPVHPYTRALLASIPKTSGPRGRLVSIEGSVPGAGELGSACRFADRCAARQDACTTGVPPMHRVAEEHWVACLEPVGYRLPSLETMS